MGSVWASFRRDCRARTVGGTDFGGAIWVFARNIVADRGGGVRGMRAGFHYFILLDPTGRQVHRADGARGSEQAQRTDCAACGAGDSGDFVGSGGAGGGERAEVFAMGYVYLGDE